MPGDQPQSGQCQHHCVWLGDGRTGVEPEIIDDEGRELTGNCKRDLRAHERRVGRPSDETALQGRKPRENDLPYRLQTGQIAEDGGADPRGEKLLLKLKPPMLTGWSKVTVEGTDVRRIESHALGEGGDFSRFQEGFSYQQTSPRARPEVTRSSIPVPLTSTACTQ